MKKLLINFFLLAFSIFMFVGCSVNSKNSMTGIYLKSTSGSNIIIDEDSFPIVMGNETDTKNIFDDLKNGDQIEITYDLINEISPGRTQIYSCKLIERGSINDISKDILDKLQEFGWEFDSSQ